MNTEPYDSSRHILHAPAGFLAAGAWDGLADLADLTASGSLTIAPGSTLQFAEVSDDEAFTALAAQLGLRAEFGRVVAPPLLPTDAETAVAECAWSLVGEEGVVEVQVAGQPYLGYTDAHTHLLGGEPAATQVRIADVIGWIPRDDGSVSLGAALNGGVVSSYLARLLGVIGTPSAITPFGTVLIHNLSEAIADQVLRVLPGMGMIFDADAAETMLRG